MVSTISRFSVIRKAARWTKFNLPWHFHLLSPGCLFNPTPRHELYLESGHHSFVVKAHSSLVNVARHLVQFFKDTKLKTETSPSSPNFGKVLAVAKHLSEKKVRWHHHLFYPNCVLNKKWGKWVIVFEDPLNNKMYQVVYPHYPSADLAKLEHAFYKQAHNSKR